MYEIVPGFLLNLLVAIVVSKATARKAPEVDAEYDEMLRDLVSPAKA